MLSDLCPLSNSFWLESICPVSPSNIMLWNILWDAFSLLFGKYLHPCAVIFGAEHKLGVDIWLEYLILRWKEGEPKLNLRLTRANINYW